MFGSPRYNFRRHLSCGRAHSTDAYQVVGQASQAHQLLVALDTAQPRLAQTAYGFAPTEELLDSFAHDLTCSISGRFERAFANASGVVTRVEGDMRSDALREQGIDKPACVIALVATDTLWSKPLAPLPGHQRQGRFGLRHAHRRGETHVADQTVTIIHQGVSGKAQPGFLAQRFAQELGLRLRGARVCVITPLLALEVPIPAGIGPRATAVLGSERFHRCPGLNQRAIDTEVLVQEQFQGSRFAHYRIKKPQGHVLTGQSLTVLAERGGVERRLLKAHVQEPAEHDVVIAYSAQSEHRFQAIVNIPMVSAAGAADTI